MYLEKGVCREQTCIFFSYLRRDPQFTSATMGPSLLFQILLLPGFCPLSAGGPECSLFVPSKINIEALWSSPPVSSAHTVAT
jgi:hypothetical protein